MSSAFDSSITRRQAIVGTATFAGYAVAVDKVLAQAIKTDTDGLAAGDFGVKIGGYEMPVYEARPASGGPYPAIIVISEVWGVHEYIRDCTRRFAKAGFYAVAPELFKREGGVAQLPNIQDILKIVFAVPRKQLLGDIQAATDWAKTRPGVAAGRFGVTGACWGGPTAIQAAAAIPDMKAAVAWYGPPNRPYVDQPSAVTAFDVAKDIKIPFLGLYGEKDTSIKLEDVTKFSEMVKAGGNPNVQIIVYPGAGHGFHADYRPSYDAATAMDAWKRCTDHFTKFLKA